MNSRASQRTVAVAGALAGGAIGAMVLAGWSVGAQSLTHPGSDGHTMSPLSAIQVLLLGLTLAGIAGARGPGERATRRLVPVRLLALFVLLLSLTRLGDYLFHWHLLSGQLGFAGTAGGASTAGPRVPPLSAFAIALLAGATWLESGRRRPELVHALSIAGTFGALVGVCRFLFGGEPLIAHAHMSIYTAVSLLLSSASLFCIAGDRGPAALLLADGPGGQLARRLLPPALLLPIVFGWASLQGQKLDWYDTRTGLTLFVLFSAFGFSGLVLLAARLLQLGDMQRRQHELAVQAHRDRLAAIINTEPECVKLVDPYGVLLEMNAAGLAMLEVDSLAAAQSGPLGRFILPEHRAAFADLHRRVMRGETGTLEFEIEGRRGTRRWLETHAAPLRETDGRVSALLGITRDITARKRAEGAQAQLQLFRDVIDQTSDLIYVADAQSRQIIDCNASLPRRLGYSREEILAMQVADLSAQPIADQEWNANIVRLRVLGSLLLERNYRCRNGTVVPVEINLRYVEHRSRPVLLAVIRDMTERQRSEAALRDYARRLQAVSRRVLHAQEDERRSLARELHDTVGQELTALALNLSIIRAAMPAALPPNVDQRLRDSQTLIEETTQHVRRVMVELRPPGLDEFGLLAALREHAGRVADRSGLSLAVTGSEPVPRLPPAVSIALFRIAQEALNNTVKHAHASEVSLDLAERDGTIRLSIADDGGGFDSALRPDSGRYGMGMTTMRERADAIGAQLNVESAIGQGTRIVVELQRSRAEARQPAIAS